MQPPAVDRTRPTEAARRKASGRSVAGGDFSRLLSADGCNTARETAEVCPPAALDALLGIQEVDDTPAERRRATARYGADLLDRLEQLRLDVLAGKISPAGVNALAHALRANRQRSEDPQLDGVIDAIELRAEVEIAKLVHFR